MIQDQGSVQVFPIHRMNFRFFCKIDRWQHFVVMNDCKHRCFCVQIESNSVVMVSEKMSNRPFLMVVSLSSFFVSSLTYSRWQCANRFVENHFVAKWFCSKSKVSFSPNQFWLCRRTLIRSNVWKYLPKVESVCWRLRLSERRWIIECCHKRSEMILMLGRRNLDWFSFSSSG
jgi:hypothetical protein